VRLLFDEQISEHLVSDLSDVYPGSTHVLTLGLGGARDRVLWDRAAADRLTIVTKDEDFHSLSVLLGPPPKVIWIRLGNCTTADVSRLLRFRREEIQAFLDHGEAAFLELG
jgi:predicted nuclease of predicted toxin-antitoxin system